MVTRLVVTVVMLTELAAARAGAAQRTAGELALRAPRFLVATTTGNMPVDAASAPVLGRRLSLGLDRVTRKQALAEIGRQTGLKFVYGDEALGLESRVSLRAEEITVAAALTDVLWDAGLDIVLSAHGQAALIRRPKGTPIGQGGAIVGRVTDSTSGRGIAGAEVLLERTRWRAETDTAGWYRLADVDSGSYLLVVRRLGYGKRTKRLVVQPGREDTVNIVLAPMPAKLDELVTTATGRQRRRDIGNAITTIQADSVMRHAVIRNLTDLLENRVPGLTSQRTTGAPGDPSKLRLRGLGSAFRSNDPVVVVDGIRLYAAQSEARSGNLTNALAGGYSWPTVDGDGNRLPANGVPAPSPLDQIDPNIIEKIEVFKGPSAATLYGADAANGVIVVTTKRGKPGPTRWNASLTYGRTTQPGRWPTGYYLWGHDSIVGTDGFCQVTNLRCTRDSLVQFQALNVPSLTVLGRGDVGTLSLTASGGTQALTYSVTGSYSDETGLLRLPDFEAARFRALHNQEPFDWMRQPHHYKTWGVTSAIGARLGATANIDLTTSLTRSEQQRSSLENQFTRLMTTYIDTLNGRYWTGSGLGAFDETANVLSNYYTRTTASTISVQTGLNANWRPRSWFTATGQAGLNIMPRSDEAFLPAKLISASDSGMLAHGTGRSLVSTLGLQGELRKRLGRGFVFTTSLGINQTTSTTNDLIGQATGLIPGTSSLGGAKHVLATDGKTNTSVFGWYIEPRIAGERLSLSTGLRLDGGSTYGARLTRSGGGLGLGGLLALPKLNGSWVISEEPFFPAMLKGVVSSLRLRGAYGQAQVQPGPLDRLRIYSRTPATTTDPALLTLTGVGNTHLKPERSTEVEGGVDADLLDSRVSVVFTAYRKMQVDALMPLQLPPSVNGGGTVTYNIGNIRNTGLELTLGLSPVRTSLLSWRTQLTFSRNRNILTKLGEGVLPQPTQGIVEGYPVGSRWAKPILGFQDTNHDGILQRREIQVGDTLVYLGRLLPDYTSALATDLALFGGALGISAGLSYDGGMTQRNELATNIVLARALSDPSAPTSELAAILAAEPVTVSQFSGGGLPQLVSPATEYGLMQEVSTLRFTSLSVNYRAPKAIARLLRAEQLTVAVQGDNLGLHSNYRGKDPDVNAWSAGEQVVDTGLLPRPRSWRLALYLQY